MIYNHETSKGRFDVNTEVRQYPRVETDKLDSRGLPKTKADSSSPMITCIGLKWTPNGIFTMESDPSIVLAKVREAQKAFPDLELHHASFYDLDGVAPLKLSFGYKKTADTAKCPHLCTSDSAGTRTPTDPDFGAFR
tara:strand:- start:650 stop:1060 length:411 start_codon:yes stop_codon:yes gene_type:complete